MDLGNYKAAYTVFNANMRNILQGTRGEASPARLSKDNLNERLGEALVKALAADGLIRKGWRDWQRYTQAKRDVRDVPYEGELSDALSEAAGTYGKGDYLSAMRMCETIEKDSPIYADAQALRANALDAYLGEYIEERISRHPGSIPDDMIPVLLDYAQKIEGEIDLYFALSFLDCASLYPGVFTEKNLDGILSGVLEIAHAEKGRKSVAGAYLYNLGPMLSASEGRKALIDYKAIASEASRITASSKETAIDYVSHALMYPTYFQKEDLKAVADALMDVGPGAADKLLRDYVFYHDVFEGCDGRGIADAFRKLQANRHKRTQKAMLNLHIKHLIGYSLGSVKAVEVEALVKGLCKKSDELKCDWKVRKVLTSCITCFDDISQFIGLCDELGKFFDVLGENAAEVLTEELWSDPYDDDPKKESYYSRDGNILAGNTYNARDYPIVGRIIRAYKILACESGFDMFGGPISKKKLNKLLGSEKYKELKKNMLLGPYRVSLRLSRSPEGSLRYNKVRYSSEKGLKNLSRIRVLGSTADVDALIADLVSKTEKSALFWTHPKFSSSLLYGEKEEYMRTLDVDVSVLQRAKGLVVIFAQASKLVPTIEEVARLLPGDGTMQVVIVPTDHRSPEPIWGGRFVLERSLNKWGVETGYVYGEQKGLCVKESKELLRELKIRPVIVDELTYWGGGKRPTGQINKILSDPCQDVVDKVESALSTGEVIPGVLSLDPVSAEAADAAVEKFLPAIADSLGLHDGLEELGIDGIEVRRGPGRCYHDPYTKKLVVHVNNLLVESKTKAVIKNLEGQGIYVDADTAKAIQSMVQTYVFCHELIHGVIRAKSNTLASSGQQALTGLDDVSEWLAEDLVSEVMQKAIAGSGSADSKWLTAFSQVCSNMGALRSVFGLGKEGEYSEQVEKGRKLLEEYKSYERVCEVLFGDSSKRKVLDLPAGCLEPLSEPEAFYALKAKVKKELAAGKYPEKEIVQLVVTSAYGKTKLRREAERYLLDICSDEETATHIEETIIDVVRLVPGFLSCRFVNEKPVS